jgi:hypothetical protein
MDINTAIVKENR